MNRINSPKPADANVTSRQFIYLSKKPSDKVPSTTLARELVDRIPQTRPYLLGSYQLPISFAIAGHPADFAQYKVKTKIENTPAVGEIPKPAINTADNNNPNKKVTLPPSKSDKGPQINLPSKAPPAPKPIIAP